LNFETGTTWQLVESNYSPWTVLGGARRRDLSEATNKRGSVSYSFPARFMSSDDDKKEEIGTPADNVKDDDQV
jgi:hypothetical protein